MSELLRFATAGSVDDGKSTLIGRLLHDSKAIFEDQLEAVEISSKRRGDTHVNLALLTDGLRAEREQGITIDVAYRYFSTPRRKFIIADTPGHVQYTRNMVTGASTADLAIVLVDARKGVLEQSRRHAYLSVLLGIRHIVLAVNKMDLVDWDETTFDTIAREFEAFIERIDPSHGRDIEVTPIPISALHGDNIVHPSENLSWYAGPPLLEHLEKVDVHDHDPADARFPVQYVIRPHSDEHHDYRGYAGQVAGGVFKPGDEVVALPSGLRTTIAAIDTFEGEIAEAFAPMSVTIRLAEELDVSRGDMIVKAGEEPIVAREIEADVCWMIDRPLTPGAKYSIKHTTRAARAVVDSIDWKLDVNTLEQTDRGAGLALNEIGRVKLRLSTPLAVDPYDINRITGSFILVDEATSATAGAGLVR
ncbi:MAG TPA: GTP-binding protein [Acidimicrobiales bacterium]|jgi:bifunctional enzyme CysN/CysC|nr:GTP-binding protein [Acidimicrobiales bacterium]